METFGRAKPLSIGRYHARNPPSCEARVRLLIATLDSNAEDWEAAIRGVNRVVELEPAIWKRSRFATKAGAAFPG